MRIDGYIDFRDQKKNLKSLTSNSSDSNTKVFKGVSQARLEAHLRARRGQNALKRKK